ncbi:arabinosyltransferase XEG113-like [Curcuma longa]|uniref:arabinosyltransferase XEG113-like n=1 Tax=Curcuma longa TaxID=136217 RepID=UPI003D9DB944
MNYQMKLIRTALAVASLLKRTLVMPPLWCRFDRIWFGHPGIVVGTLTRQPFRCPMDHLFQVNVMRSNLSEAEFGPQIDFREYSFLQNSLVPKHVKESVLDVQLCDTHTRGCNTSEKSTSQGFIRFPRNSTEQMEYNKSSERKMFSQATMKVNVVEYDQSLTQKNLKSSKMGPRGGFNKKKFFEKCFNCDRVGYKSSECRKPKKKEETNLN